MEKLQKLETEAISFIRENNSKNTVVSLSGGKDSLVALDLSVRAGIKKAVFCDTTIEFPETIEYVKSLQNFYNISLEIVRNSKSFFEVTSMIGFPSRYMRWCCEIFKFQPLARYAKENNVEAFVTGLRLSESKKRLGYGLLDKNPLINVSQVNPILKWTSKNVWDYINKYSLPTNPLYKIYERIGCWACPYTTKEEWKKIKKIHPELIEKLHEKIIEFARKKGLKEPENFAKKDGWLNWRPSYQKWHICHVSPCWQNKGTIIIRFYSKEHLEKVLKLLPILIRSFKTIGNQIRLPNTINMISLRILIEKAINCINCNACLQLCPNNALLIKDGDLSVDVSKCNQCGECLKTTKLRGGCIVRNYSDIRGVVDFVNI